MTTRANIPDFNPAAMMSALPGGLMAFLVPTDCLRSLENWPPFQRAFRQYVGNPEAIYSLYDNVQRQPDGNYAFDFQSFYTDFLRWTGQPFINIKNQSKMPTEGPKGPSAEQIYNDPNFERTRENMAEFGRAGKSASLMREIFRDLTVYAKDSELQSRLFTVLRRIVSSDSVNKRGERTVGSGDHAQLQGFNFNARASLRSSLYVRCAVTIDRAAGTATIAIPSFVPKVLVKGAKGTTHYRIVAGVTAVNFETEAFHYERGATNELPWDHTPTVASNLVLNFPANSPDTILVAVGVEYMQQLNGSSYPLKSSDVNATAIVAVSQP